MSTTAALASSPRRAARADHAFGAALAVVVAHVALGLLAEFARPVVSLQAVGVIGLGLWWALSDARPGRAVHVAVYVASCDVLWRMSQARVPWEGAKYASMAILAVVLVRHVRRIRTGPALYLAVLLPSVLLTLGDLGLSEARDPISFNMSGPLLLALSACVLGALRCDVTELRSLGLLAAAPAIAVATRTAWGTYFSGASIEFGTESNFAASGGFGPNQVSALLGFGALVLLLIVLHERDLRLRVLLAVVALGLVAQGFLTFSRGGMVSALVGLAVAILVVMRDPRAAARVVVGLVVVALVGVVLFARLDEFTGGALGSRFSDTDPTGRDELAQKDLDVWLDHPVIGVGPGRAYAYRDISGELEEAAAHTEFTRLLAEHGMLGLVAIAALGAVAGRRFLATTTLWERAWVAGLISWSAVTMLTGAMRIGAVAMAWGLALIALQAPRRGRATAAVPARVS